MKIKSQLGECKYSIVLQDITDSSGRIFGSALHRGKREICESDQILTITVPDEAQARTSISDYGKPQEIYEFVMKELL